mgnify:CR=1 FL=1
MPTSSLPHLAPQGEGEETVVHGPIELTVVYAHDIGHPREDARPCGRGQWLLTLTDGSTQCMAFESVPLPELDERSAAGRLLCSGARIEVSSCRVFAGVLCLTPGCTRLLGGVGTPEVDQTSQLSSEWPECLRIAASPKAAPKFARYVPVDCGTESQSHSLVPMVVRSTRSQLVESNALLPCPCPKHVASVGNCMAEASSAPAAFLEASCSLPGAHLEDALANALHPRQCQVESYTESFGKVIPEDSNDLETPDVPAIGDGSLAVDSIDDAALIAQFVAAGLSLEEVHAELGLPLPTSVADSISDRCLSAHSSGRRRERRAHSNSKEADLSGNGGRLRGGRGRGRY